MGRGGEGRGRGRGGEGRGGERRGRGGEGRGGEGRGGEGRGGEGSGRKMDIIGLETKRNFKVFPPTEMGALLEANLTVSLISSIKAQVFLL